MMPEQGYRDFVSRAIRNYEFIRSHATHDGPYEVTQLLASFLLVAGWPEERDILPKKMATMTIAEAEERGFPKIGVLSDYPEYQPKNFAGMMKLLRNSVAHANVQYFGRHNEIREIALSDRRWNRGERRNEFRTTVRIPISVLEDALLAIGLIADEEFEQATQRTA